MSAWALLAVVLATIPVQTKFAQLAPVSADAIPFQRSDGRDRAVILIHGFKPQPFSDHQVCCPEWHTWQRLGSDLLRAMGREADLFGFAYGQNATVEQIARSPALAAHIQQIRMMGYGELVLLGHSTGGIIAREFVEDNPKAGVTKVIQVCTPNTGTALARTTFGIRKIQEPLLLSLSFDARQQALRDRNERKIPAHVEFVCVVGRLPDKGNGKNDDGTDTEAKGDGVVTVESQWSEDLRKQGIPAVVVPLWHNAVLRNEPGIGKVVSLVREKQPRWTPEKVAEQKPSILNGSK